MARKGRPTSAPAIIGRLPGSAAARSRVLAIVRNLGGSLPVSEACSTFGISPSMFRRWRSVLLRSAVKSLEPRPPGRPLRMVPPHARRLAALEKTIRHLEEELQMAQLREELALVVPQASARQKKKLAIVQAKSAAVPPDLPPDNTGGEAPGPVSQQH